MKMKKLLSIGALALTIVSCISIGASAAEVAGAGNKKEAMEAIVTKGLSGGQVLYGVNITANTKVGSYLTNDFIEEANKFLASNNLNLTIKSTDTFKDIKGNVLETLSSLDATSRDAAVVAIRDYLLDKLSEFEEASSTSNSALVSKIKEYFKTGNYGTLTVGTNMDNAKTVSLVKNSKILAQINTNNVYKVADKLESVNSYDDLKAFVSDDLKNLIK